MNEFNVLLNAATNGTPSGSLFDALFARYIAPQESWRELESPLPITILSAGEPLIDYRIYGNTENGKSVGERTENLFDGVLNRGCYAYADGTFINTPYYVTTNFIPCAPKQQYIFRCITDLNGSTDCGFVFFDSEKGRIDAKYTPPPTGVNIITYTAESPENAAYLVINIASNSRITPIIPSDITDFMLIEGSTAPASYIPYGFKLPMVVRSENLFDKNATDINNGYIYNKILGASGATSNSSNWIVSEYIEIGGQNVLINPFDSTPLPSTYPAVCFYTSEYVYISGVQYNNINVHKIQVPANAKYARMSVFKPYLSSASIVDYEETPIYIGSDPLAEDEYVDFGEQKVYRMAGGTLTPTDPPVPIPALPTIQGETIIDYNPSKTPAVEPEKMYVKYKPQ